MNDNSICALLAAVAGLMAGFVPIQEARGQEEQARVEMYGRASAAAREFRDAVMKEERSAEEKAELARQPLSVIDELLQKDPQFGPASAWRGVVKEALGDAAGAVADYDHACDLSPESAPVWCLRGMSRAWKYAWSRDLPRWSFWKGIMDPVPMPVETKEETALREGALADLERMKTLSQDALLGAEDRRMGLASAALLRGDAAGCSEALETLKGLSTPGAAGIVALAHAGRKELDEAVAGASEVLVAWPMADEVRARRGLLRVELAFRMADAGKDPRDTLTAAVEDHSMVLKRGFDPARAHRDRGLAHTRLAAAQAQRGDNPTATCGKAVTDYGEALKVRPMWTEALVGRGVAAWTLGKAEEDHGADGRDNLRKALPDLDEAIVHDPEDLLALKARAVLRLTLGDAERMRFVDAREIFTKGIVDCDKVLGIAPNAQLVYYTRANLEVHLGNAEPVGSPEASADYERGIKDYDEVLKRTPEAGIVYTKRAAAFLKLGNALDPQGKDPRENYRRSIADCDEAIKRGSNQSTVYFDRGNARANLAAYEAAHEVDPRESYKTAIADFQEALKRNPAYWEASSMRATAWTGIADAEAKAGDDARESYKKAIDGYDESFKLFPNSSRFGRARALEKLAAAEEAHGDDPSATIDKAIAEYEADLKMHPGVWGTALAEGNLWLKKNDKARAIACFQLALKFSPGQKEVVDALLALGVEPAPEWAGITDEGDDAIQHGNYDAARARYEDGLAKATEADEQKPAARPKLQSAHYNLACIYALKSDGRESPKAEKKPISAEEASRLRERAFQHLRKAIDLGYTDAQHIGEDTDLVPLHDDPRWAEVLKSLAK